MTYDAMKSFLAVTLLSACSAFAQTPAINPNGVVNAASGTPPASSGANVLIAQGSLVAIYGTNMGPATLIVAPAPPLAATLAGTSIKVTSGTTDYIAYPYYTSAGQVAAIMPSNVPLGNATVTLTYNGKVSAGQVVTIVKSAFGIFAKNSGGSGPAVVQNFYSDGSLKTNALATAAVAGQTLVLYGTGLGPTTSADNVTPPTANIGTNVTINVGGQVITPSYAGRSFYPGLDQINFQLPAAAPGPASPFEIAPPAAGPAAITAGCYVPVTLVTGTNASNQTTLSIASGATPVCTHVMGLSPSALSKLDNGGTVNVGIGLAARIGLGYGITGDGAGLAFITGNANDIFLASLQAANNNASTPQYGQTGCYTVNLLAGAPTPSATVSISGFAYSRYLNAGASLGFSGPGSSQPLNTLSAGGYGAGGTFLTNGSWSLSGTGGPDIGAFKTNVAVPVLTWTNATQFDSQTVARGAITVNWTGGNPTTMVAISGSSLVLDIFNPQNTQDVEFICYTPASALTFTVPAAIVKALPSNVVSSGVGSVGTLSLSAGDATSFTAPLTGGGQLDGGIFGGASTDVRGVTWN